MEVLVDGLEQSFLVKLLKHGHPLTVPHLRAILLIGLERTTCLTQLSPLH